MLQFRLRGLQAVALGFRHVLARAVDVESQHRERGAVGAGLAARAVLRGPFEGSCDFLRAGLLEDATFEIERVAFLRDAL